MDRTLKLLASCRQARRDVAIARLSEARSRLDMALAACADARAAEAQARRWQGDVLAACTLGRSQAVRDAVLPACEALLQRRHARLGRCEDDRREAQDHLTRRRRELTGQERDVLRLGEWQRSQASDNRRTETIRDSLDDEDSPTRMSALRSAAVARFP